MGPPVQRPASISSVISKKSKLKQGSLFSFFSKKKPTDASQSNLPATQPESTASKSIDEASNLTIKDGPLGTNGTKSHLLDNIAIGCRIEVYWDLDDEWYAAVVSKHRGKKHFIEYDDGQNEWIDLSTQKFRLEEKKSSEENNFKRRRILVEEDEQDEEFEFDHGISDEEGSEFKAEKASETEDDEEMDFMGTDEGNNADLSQSRNSLSNKRKNAVPFQCDATRISLSQFKAGKVKVTEYGDNTSEAIPGTTPKQITPSSSTLSNKKTPLQATSPPVVQLSSKFSSSPQATKAQNKKSTMFIVNEQNPMGSHVHNHLKFLKNPKDSMGRTRDHPEYDPRTLYVDEREWEKVTGKPMTDAVKQWWDLKSQYFDTVLLFKTGKFYEMFHMDADIGVQVCGFIHMKGHCAHSGFPEISYGQFADKLVRAGYKVARVEQTETPQQLQERKKKHKGKGAPKVVNREVCSIMTIGTRTFCYLDQSEIKDKEMDRMSSPDDAGSLLAIKEIPAEAAGVSSDCDDEVKPVCEYGITLVDAARGTVTVGQFADDVLRSRMLTLLTTFSPSEVLLEGGENGASDTLRSLIRSWQLSNQLKVRVEDIKYTETFPKSTAVDAKIRRQLDRGSGAHANLVHPWNVRETLDELHRRKYYPRASKQTEDKSINRWPPVLQAMIEGEANLALMSFGACLYYLQRSMIDFEILSMGIVEAYIPPDSCTLTDQSKSTELLHSGQHGFVDKSSTGDRSSGQISSITSKVAVRDDFGPSVLAEKEISYMALDGTTLHNLEILTNAVDHKVAGSLWSKINFTKTPHGSRLLRAWLLRPLFRKADIDRRLDAVSELVSVGASNTGPLKDARAILARCGDIERLLSRVHSMGGSANIEGDESDRFHPNDRAVLYETAAYTKRKVGDFSKVLNGLRHASQIPELFDKIDIKSGLLKKVVRLFDHGGCFPNMTEELDWFFANFDCDQAAKGMFKPSRGIDDLYDKAQETIQRIEAELEDYRNDMCTNYLTPRSLAKSSWNYVNTKPESKDKYMIELPAAVEVPDDFIMKGKRGSGAKQINKYRTQFLDQLVQELELALEVMKKRKAIGMQLIFAKFDSKRDLWAAAAYATAVLDALGSLAHTASKPGYTRPHILDCSTNASPTVKITKGRHPCVENSMGSDFIPNDLYLGSANEDGPCPRVLLLSGPNMGGKSTLLRQTCLIAILSQLGSFVPAEECELTPVDRIFTRLGASDRILLGQSTFFVELAETAGALRGATRRSLVIMDELGRGTSTFDGTAIASASVLHLVERSKCLCLFATHYHSLLDEWKDDRRVLLGHMECLVESNHAESHSEHAHTDDTNITFLYTLAEGVCPKSFGINVARLAGLPNDVLINAKQISGEFEKEICSMESSQIKVTALNAASIKEGILACIENNDWENLLLMQGY